MLKAVDTYFEKRISERRFDFSLSPALQRDCIEFLDDKEIEEIRTQMRLRSNMAVTSNYIALACPFLPMAFLNAFFALNKLDNNYGRQLLSRDILQGRHEEAMKAAAVLADMERRRKDKDNTLADKRFNALLDKHVNMPARIKVKDKQVMFKSQSMETLNRSMFNKQKKQSEIDKIIKAKTFLKAKLEKSYKEKDVIGANRLNAKLFLLEKNLKRLGC